MAQSAAALRRARIQRRRCIAAVARTGGSGRRPHPRPLPPDTPARPPHPRRRADALLRPPPPLRPRGSEGADGRRRRHAAPAGRLGGRQVVPHSDRRGGWGGFLRLRRRPVGVLEAPRLAPQGRPRGGRHTPARRTSGSYRCREKGWGGGARPWRASGGNALREGSRTSTLAGRGGEDPAPAAAVTAHGVMARIELLARLVVVTCTKVHSTIIMYTRADGSTAVRLAGKNTQPLTHPTTLRTTTKHIVTMIKEPYWRPPLSVLAPTRP